MEQKTKENFKIEKIKELRRNNLTFINDFVDLVIKILEKYSNKDITYFKLIFKDEWETVPYLWNKDNIDILKLIFNNFDDEKILKIIEEVIFRKCNFDDPNLKDKAMDEFENFIKGSYKDYLDINHIFSLNINTELLFDNEIKTSDGEFNNYIENARKYFIENDKKTALEKLWDAFERIKTLTPEEDKKKSAEQVLKLISVNVKEDDFCKEFNLLTEIGNTYMIRHSEKSKIPINDDNTMTYLFFRMYSLLNLCTSKMNLN